MSGASGSLARACRQARLAAFLLCGGTSALTAGLALSGLVPPGGHRPEGPLLQLGQAFTGLILLSAAWVVWRRGRVMDGFAALPEAQRPQVVVRETLRFAALFALGGFCGLAYWGLVGQHAARHALGFILLPPILCLAFLPRRDRWEKAAGPVPEGSRGVS